MGAKQGKREYSEKPEDSDEEIDREEIQYLLDNTHFSEDEIKQWYNGFMVSKFQIFKGLFNLNALNVVFFCLF